MQTYYAHVLMYTYVHIHRYTVHIWVAGRKSYTNETNQLFSSKIIFL